MISTPYQDIGNHQKQFNCQESLQANKLPIYIYQIIISYFDVPAQKIFRLLNKNFNNMIPHFQEKYLKDTTSKIVKQQQLVPKEITQWLEQKLQLNFRIKLYSYIQSQNQTYFNNIYELSCSKIISQIFGYSSLDTFMEFQLNPQNFPEIVQQLRKITPNTLTEKQLQCLFVLKLKFQDNPLEISLLNKHLNKIGMQTAQFLLQTYDLYEKQLYNNQTELIAKNIYINLMDQIQLQIQLNPFNMISNKIFQFQPNPELKINFTFPSYYTFDNTNFYLLISNKLSAEYINNRYQNVFNNLFNYLSIPELLRFRLVSQKLNNGILKEYIQKILNPKLQLLLSYLPIQLNQVYQSFEQIHNQIMKEYSEVITQLNTVTDIQYNLILKSQNNENYNLLAAIKDILGIPQECILEFDFLKNKINQLNLFNFILKKFNFQKPKIKIHLSQQQKKNQAAVLIYKLIVILQELTRLIKADFNLELHYKLNSKISQTQKYLKIFSN